MVVIVVVAALVVVVVVVVVVVIEVVIVLSNIGWSNSNRIIVEELVVVSSSISSRNSSSRSTCERIISVDIHIVVEAVYLFVSGLTVLIISLFVGYIVWSQVLLITKFLPFLYSHLKYKDYGSSKSAKTIYMILIVDGIFPDYAFRLLTKEILLPFCLSRL